MIFTEIGPDVPFYRALTPRWSSRPESGAGAARVGGRFNRPGIEARYLAASAPTALAEYQGESALLPPATLATFLVTAARVVDFSRGFDAEHWTPIWAEAHCEWKRLAFLERTEPPSWTIGDLVLAADASGILYPSTRDPTGTCLVLFPSQQHRFRAPVFDPERRLPRDDRSWTGERG